MSISRDVAARLGAEADDINRSGQYLTPAGRTVSIAAEIERAAEGTRYIPPDEPIEHPRRRVAETRVEVRAEETLAAARDLIEAGRNPVVLNFATGTVPGGGYRTGSRAQEESIAWSSALVPSLARAPEFHALHRKLGDQLYTDAMIYSPGVPVFRNGETLLDEPWTVGVISAAAPRVPGAMGVATEEAFRRRIPRILRLGLREGHDSIVLGAWGCGANGNDPRVVARIFRDAIDEIRGAYAVIVFAIADVRGDGENLVAFSETLAPPDKRVAAEGDTNRRADSVS